MNGPAHQGCAHETGCLNRIRNTGGNEMTISAIDESQHKAARVAGFAYLITFATVLYVNFGIHFA